jgi:ribosomal protein L11 methyltransferase
VVETIVGREVVLPSGETLSREEFLERAWALLDGTGLAGIDEGSIDVAEAFAEGLADAPLVIDAAAAPPRDWVAGRRLLDAAFWFPAEPEARLGAAVLVRAVGCAVAAIRRERERDWAADARAAIGPVHIPGFGTVVPPWHAPPPASAGAATTLVIDPGLGFGTGAHATTRQCLAAIAAILAPHAARGEARVLDFGAGSGILAIAAALLGAAAVEAVEIDDRVHDAIRRNALHNGVADRVIVSRTPDGTDACRLVVANIVAPVLLEHAPALAARLCAGGTIVLSGLREADLAAVVDRYRGLGLSQTMATESEGWHCLAFSAPTAAT